MLRECLSHRLARGEDIKVQSRHTLEEPSVAGFTPEVVEYFGAKYFDVEHQKKHIKEAWRVKESAAGNAAASAAAGVAANADKTKRKPQFSPTAESCNGNPWVRHAHGRKA
jgi:hypothetical protein